MNEEKTLRKAIITAAGPTPSMSPYPPLTPEQIANDAVGAFEAGAAIAHIHARKPETGDPAPDLNVFREILTEIKRQTNMIICITTGGRVIWKSESRSCPNSNPNWRP